MNLFRLLFLSCSCFIMGTILFLVQKEYVIFRSPFSKHGTAQSSTTETDTIKKKKIYYYFWHREQWQEEQKVGLWSDKKDVNLKYIINTWLDLAQQEGVLITKTQVQSIALNHNGYTAFVSFDQNPLPRNEPLYTKLCFIHGLLKTIQRNTISLQSIHFLHNHASLQDSHIDFSQPWPIEGFLPQ